MTHLLSKNFWISSRLTKYSRIKRLVNNMIFMERMELKTVLKAAKNIKTGISIKTTLAFMMMILK